MKVSRIKGLISKNDKERWEVRYLGFLQEVVRFFSTEERARQWRAQVGKKRATIKRIN